MATSGDEQALVPIVLPQNVWQRVEDILLDHRGDALIAQALRALRGEGEEESESSLTISARDQLVEVIPND